MRILTRASVFIACWAAFFLVVVSSLATPDDARIGTGLLTFGLVALGALAWGWYDGTRMSFGRLAVAWGCVGLLMGLLVPLFTAIAANELDSAVVPADVIAGIPFTAALVAGPALLGGLVGPWLLPRRRPDLQPEAKRREIP